MKKKALFQIAAVSLASLAFLAQPAAAAVGAASFHAFTPADVPFISYVNLGTVFNSDTATVHNVIEAETALVTGPAVITRTIFGVGNGQPLTCTVVARSLTSGALFTGGGGTSASGLFNFPVGVNVSAAGIYTVTVLCTLPKAAGGTALLFGSM